MKTTPPFFVLLGIFAAMVAGCGSPEIKPPANAVMHHPTGLQPPKTWTKADKIAAIQKAAIPEEQKKAEIAKVNAGQD